jgi:hypothetical protein
MGISVSYLLKIRWVVLSSVLIKSIRPMVIWYRLFFLHVTSHFPRLRSTSLTLSWSSLGLTSRVNSAKTDLTTSAAEAFCRSTTVTRSAIYSMAPGLVAAFWRSVRSAHHPATARLPARARESCPTVQDDVNHEGAYQSTLPWTYICMQANYKLERVHTCINVVGVRALAVLSQRVNLCCVSQIWIVMQREYTGGLFWFERKKALRPAGVLYFLAPKCLRRGYKLWEREPIPGLGEKVRVQRRLLEILIFYGGMMTWFFFFPFPFSPS